MTRVWGGEVTVPDVLATSAVGVVRELTGACSWYGNATGHWWSIVWCFDGAWRLVEASDPRDMISTIRTLRSTAPATQGGFRTATIAPPACRGPRKTPRLRGRSGRCSPGSARGERVPPKARPPTRKHVEEETVSIAMAIVAVAIVALLVATLGGLARYAMELHRAARRIRDETERAVFWSGLRVTIIHTTPGWARVLLQQVHHFINGLASP
jgi:hypothetical protein